MTLKDNWRKFHNENPEVYELVERFTFDAIRAGRKHFSIKAIFERIRWYTAVETRGEPFKLSNNHRPYYARHFMEMNPKYKGFFRTNRVPTDLPDQHGFDFMDRRAS